MIFPVFMEEEFIELLKSIGLTKGEIDVYLDLLKNQASTAYLIAKRINQHRSGVYDSLRKLQNKALIVEIKDKNKSLFQTKEYTSIEEYLKQKQEDLKKITPYLKEISNTEMPEGKVSISYGLARLRTIFSNILESNDEVLIWILPSNVNEVLGDWFLKEINQRIIKNKVPVKLICSNTGSISNLEKNPLLEFKMLNEESPMFTIVSSNYVFLVVLGSTITVIEMKDANIANGFKARFLFSWEKAELISSM